MREQLHFARDYDAMMFDARNRDIYGASGFFNVGYWRADTPDQSAACRNLVERLMRWLPADVGQVLDVGCGFGAGTRTIKQLRPHAMVTGVNISERQLRQCRIGVPDCGFGLMDAANLCFAAGRFDAVISVEAAFHFRTRAAFLDEAFRVLRPGGRLILSDIAFRDARWMGEWMVPAENAVTTPDAYAGLLRRAGFRDIALVDATANCWTAFCRRRLAAIDADHAAERLDPRSFAMLSDYFTNLRDRCLGHYLLAAARKPVNAPA